MSDQPVSNADKFPMTTAAQFEAADGGWYEDSKTRAWLRRNGEWSLGACGFTAGVMEDGGVTLTARLVDGREVEETIALLQRELRKSRRSVAPLQSSLDEARGLVRGLDSLVLEMAMVMERVMEFNETAQGYREHGKLQSAQSAIERWGKEEAQNND